MRWRRSDNWHKNNRVLHHNYVPIYTALAVQHFLASKNMTVIPHPSYSPDLAPCDLFLFSMMKIKLKGWRYDPVEEIQAKLQKVLKDADTKDFQDSFQLWQKRWNCCVNSQGDFFEGDSGDKNCECGYFFFVWYTFELLDSTLYNNLNI